MSRSCAFDWQWSRRWLWDAGLEVQTLSGNAQTCHDRSIASLWCRPFLTRKQACCSLCFLAISRLQLGGCINGPSVQCNFYSFMPWLKPGSSPSHELKAWHQRCHYSLQAHSLSGSPLPVCIPNPEVPSWSECPRQPPRDTSEPPLWGLLFSIALPRLKGVWTHSWHKLSELIELATH